MWKRTRVPMIPFVAEKKFAPILHFTIIRRLEAQVARHRHEALMNAEEGFHEEKHIQNQEKAHVDLLAPNKSTIEQSDNYRIDRKLSMPLSVP